MIVKYKDRQLSEYQREIFEYSLNVYRFLIPLDVPRLSILEFANLIKENYSLDNPQNAEVYRVLIEIWEAQA